MEGENEEVVGTVQREAAGMIEEGMPVSIPRVCKPVSLEVSVCIGVPGKFRNCGARYC